MATNKKKPPTGSGWKLIKPAPTRQLIGSVTDPALLGPGPSHIQPTPVPTAATHVQAPPAPPRPIDARPFQPGGSTPPTLKLPETKIGSTLKKPT